MGTLQRFVEESNRIEGIRGATANDLGAHAELLTLDRIRRADLVAFVDRIAGAPLRDREGMNVRVGQHYPPPGNREMGCWLDDLLEAAFVGAMRPWETHVRYERLHPFMDGNGRSGRALWAWQREREDRDPFALGFLHAAYYEALEPTDA